MYERTVELLRPAQTKTVGTRKKLTPQQTDDAIQAAFSTTFYRQIAGSNTLREQQLIPKLLALVDDPSAAKGNVETAFTDQNPLQLDTWYQTTLIQKTKLYSMLEKYTG